MLSMKTTPESRGWGSEIVPSVHLQLFLAHEQCLFSRLIGPGCAFRRFHETGRVVRLGWDALRYLFLPLGPTPCRRKDRVR